MIIVPRLLAESYYLNFCGEEAIAHILKYFGYEVSDISTGKARPEYDYVVDRDVQVEQKITGDYDIPVETHKDEARLIPSGFLTSTAPLAIFLSKGGSEEAPVGKLRIYKRSTLLDVASRHPGTGRFIRGKTASQGAYVHHLSARRGQGLDDHLWLGDMKMVDTVFDGVRLKGYNTQTFRENYLAHKELGLWLQWAREQ